MINHIILVGQTCTGKTTLAREFESIGYKKIPTTTTRPIREGEVHGVDYYFVDDDTFDALETAGYFEETTEYDAAFGKCKYGSPLAAFEASSYTNNKTITILNPDGIFAIRNRLKIQDNIFVVLLEATTNRILSRAKRRGDDLDEVRRRIKADNPKFVKLKEESLYDMCFNTDMDMPLDLAVATIYKNAIIKQHRNNNGTRK